MNTVWWILALLTAANGLRLKVRVRRFPVLEATDAEVDTHHRFFIASGVLLDDATRRAASAYARDHGIEVLELWPADLPIERTMAVARHMNPKKVRSWPRPAPCRGPDQALLITRDTAIRAGLHRGPDAIVVMDQIDLHRALERAVAASPYRRDLVIAPTLRASANDHPRRLHHHRAVFGSRAALLPASEAVTIVVLVVALFAAIFSGSAAAAWFGIAFGLQPAMATDQTPLRPRDKRWLPLLRREARAVNWWRMMRATHLRPREQREAEARQSRVPSRRAATPLYARLAAPPPSRPPLTTSPASTTTVMVRRPTRPVAVPSRQET